MSDTGGVSPGEIGGVFAGVVALLVAIGHGIKWLFNWNDARNETRAAKLDAWHRELSAREGRLSDEQQAYRDRIERRLMEIERENHALRIAFELVAAPLRTLDPDNGGLIKAEKLLAAAFPLVPHIPPDMAATLGQID